MNNKFYFITYQWSSLQRGTHISNDVINVSPMQWLDDCKDIEENYVVLFAMEITEDEYNKFENEF